jgi:hypothetical protein
MSRQEKHHACLKRPLPVYVLFEGPIPLRLDLVFMPIPSGLRLNTRVKITCACFGVGASGYTRSGAQ